MRKTSDVPTRIYSYRCLPPLTEAARVEDQFRLAAYYRNTLVEIERRLRDRIRDAQHAIPEVSTALALYESVTGEIDDVYDDLRAAKAGVAEPDLAAHRERLEAAKELRFEWSNALREAKKAHHEELLPGYEAARAKANAERKAARADYITRGLRHGAYTRIEDAVKQAANSTKRPLKFLRYEGAGSIGTQLTESGRSGGIRGMTVSELHSLADPRLRLQALPENYWQMPRNRRRHAARVRVWLRIGSNPDRSPIFAEFPVTFHRPLPKDAVIKWAYVVRKRIGHQYEWRLQLTIESETFRTPSQSVGEGACAVDLGWRRTYDDQGEQVGLRAGYVVDDKGKERGILVPEKLWRGMSKVYDLGRIRDLNLERAQFSLSDWMVGRDLSAWAAPETDGSRTMEDRLRGYDRWRSPRKLQVFVDRWRARRIDGDDAIYAVIQAWAKQDRHLQSWQEHQRSRLIAHRREMWRVIATELARTYAVILVEDGQSRTSMMALPSIPGWKQPAPEDGDPSDGKDQRSASRLAAVGELRVDLVKAASKTGARVEVERCVASTTECAWCGSAEVFDAAASIKHLCVCGRTWDQDANACRNLLHRHGLTSGPPPEGPIKVPESAKRPRPQGTSGSAFAVPCRPEE